MSVLIPGASVVASPPAPVQVAGSWRSREGLVFLDGGQSGGRGMSILAADPLEVLQGNFASDLPKLKRLMSQHAAKFSTSSGIPEGGLFGWIGFDGRYVLGVYPQCHVYEHDQQRWLGAAPKISNEWQDDMRPPHAALHFKPLMDKKSFCERVQRTLDYIAAGDIYQVNLSYPWVASWPDSLGTWSFFERLRQVSPAPYGAYLSLAGTEVCSASPECFLKLSGRHVITRPIKGTRPRGLNPELDEQLARELMSSAKERAELVMITDLERNDIGQFCEFGSVKVTGLCELERYAQVQHLVSTVEGTLRTDKDHLDAVAASFPGGSISGAPKKRALQIIQELENHDRGLYTGAIGYFGFNGESQFSIAIRTAWRSAGVMRFDVGAGIVADSIAEKEWEETWHKAAGILEASRAL